MKNWNVRKVIAAPELIPEHQRLHRSLGWPHLIALGVGAIVGTGILTLTGVGAAKAGPAVLLSFAIAGIICAAAALAYAEMATMYPAAGSAYTYSYVVFGELIAWIVGWSLILEYSLVVSAVAVGWSGYAAGFLTSIGAGLPTALIQGPALGGVINLPAIFIIAVVAGLLIYGTRESANINAILVVVKLAALALFVIVALPYFDIGNFEPFMPYGFQRSGPSGSEVGVMAAAAIIFFAFYGFDAIATAAEETKNPDRDLGIGIVGSMVLCVIIYMVVAAAAIGALSYLRFANSPEPLALILREIGQPWAARILAIGAVVALPTNLARVSSRGTPVRITIFTAIVVAVIAGLFPLADIAALANAGTLAAFIAVSAAMLTMRRRAPDAPRKFTTPLPWVVGTGAILGCAYLFWSLPVKTQIYFLIWNAAGLLLYFVYGSPRAEKARAGTGG